MMAYLRLIPGHEPVILGYETALISGESGRRTGPAGLGVGATQGIGAIVPGNHGSRGVTPTRAATGGAVGARRLSRCIALY
ncbi:hypothetical protein EF879_11825 [Micromonospora sp. HM5-17]|jgi:hypothetical protein|nr:hypothetical protein EF879_11825 [Micromonospora sp. HM5-17]